MCRNTEGVRIGERPRIRVWGPISGENTLLIEEQDPESSEVELTRPAGPHSTVPVSKFG
jgi:hypothetical protein